MNAVRGTIVLTLMCALSCARAADDEASGADASNSAMTKDAATDVVSPLCTQPEVSCAGDDGSVCVNASSDPNHCGNCATACAVADAGDMVPGTGNPDPGIFDAGYDGGIGWALGTAACANGQCAVDCPLTLTRCTDQICYDTQNQHDHCGDCNTACAANTAWCTQGHCCDVDTTWCASACASVLTDPNNCGSCGIACDGGACQNGVCIGCTPSTISGPTVLTGYVSSYPKAGLRITALTNTTLTSFVVNNQGAADTVDLTTTTGTVLYSVAVPAGHTSFTASVSWSLMSGTSYDLILEAGATSGTNGRWETYAFPQSSTALKVVATVNDTQTLFTAWWFTFTTLVSSCP